MNSKYDNRKYIENNYNKEELRIDNTDIYL